MNRGKEKSSKCGADSKSDKVAAGEGDMAAVQPAIYQKCQHKRADWPQRHAAKMEQPQRHTDSTLNLGDMETD